MLCPAVYLGADYNGIIESFHRWVKESFGSLGLKESFPDLLTNVFTEYAVGELLVFLLKR